MIFPGKLVGRGREQKAVRLSIQLPPVELIQIDDVYFVVDGHHRLSIAQAMGETAIEANVTIHEIMTPQYLA